MSDLYCDKCVLGPLLGECPIHFEVGNSRSVRPAPELPEGYRVEDHGNGGETLWTPQGHPLMVWGMDGSVEGWYSASFNTDVTEEAAEHAQALAIWLQRRSK